MKLTLLNPASDRFNLENKYLLCHLSKTPVSIYQEMEEYILTETIKTPKTFKGQK
jgi:hypothetical protein